MSQSAAAFFSAYFQPFLSTKFSQQGSAKVRNHYFPKRRKVLAKLTSKNQLTLPKSVTNALGPVQYFEVQSSSGQIILTPVRIQRGDALRAKLGELKIDAKTIESALAWDQAAATKKPRKAVLPKKLAAKPLSEGSDLGRLAVTSTTANLKASLTRVLAKAGKR